MLKEKEITLPEVSAKWRVRKLRAKKYASFSANTNAHTPTQHCQMTGCALKHECGWPKCERDSSCEFSYVQVCIRILKCAYVFSWQDTVQGTTTMLAEASTLLI